ncbi:MAG: hypothetical protein JWM73_2402 [Solirubrobacterales bacterium]|nr:hypothetical protein [Solirubrobacterales bacterium]
MTFDAALALLRGWCGRAVRVELEPEGTRLAGLLSELDPAGVDGALFALDQEQLSGVAFALFRDGAEVVRHEDGVLVVEQGRVTVTVALAG